MADAADPWAGMIDPRIALAAAKQAAGTLASFSQHPAEVAKVNSPSTTKSYDNSSHFSHFSRGAHATKPFSHNSPKDRKETCSSSLSMGYAIPAYLDSLIDPEFVRLDALTPAKVANRLKYGVNASNHSESTLASSCESFSVTNTVPSPTAHLHRPREWQDGVVHLDQSEPPCPGFRAGEWEAIGRTVRHFMDHCADEAATRGWTALDLFGVHPVVGAVRVDCCGALMLPSSSFATVITAEAITFGPLVYRKRVMREAVLAWDFGRSAA